MFYIILSFISGIIIVLSRILNTKLTEKTSLMESTYFNYFTAAIFCFILFLISKENISSIIFSSLPVYAYLGGILGTGIVALNSVVTPKLPSFYVTLLIFITQIFTGFIIDGFLYGTIPYAKIIGGLIVTIGFTYNLYVDSTEN